MTTGCDLVEEGWLSCGMEPGDFLKQIRAYSQKDFILLVGHEPDFSDAIACLVDLLDLGASAKPNSRSWRSRRQDYGCGQLQFLIPARLM